jgi:hypothetical protein
LSFLSGYGFACHAFSMLDPAGPVKMDFPPLPGSMPWLFYRLALGFRPVAGWQCENMVAQRRAVFQQKSYDP